MLSGRGVCFGLITRPEESYRERVCHEASIMWRSWLTGGCCTMVKNIFIKRNVFLIT